MSLSVIGLIVVTCGFLGLVIWAFAPRNKKYFDAMGNIPLDRFPEDTDARVTPQERNES